MVNQNIIQILRIKQLNEEKVEKGRQSLIKHAIISQNMLSYLKENHAEYYEQISDCIIHREDELSLEAFELDESKRSLGSQTSILLGSLSDSCKLHNDNLKQISQGTISDWLMRCPLDFE
jgi:hypothetical protein